ncbi:hypothetical protein V494_08520 [Pseudogymnoascus sp. VKM F-4513 (FW-928)]|nr:hypothetical protein V494_08520 [Pseudogymnoascus sp. VKM F-4513 (FW-928)]
MEPESLEDEYDRKRTSEFYEPFVVEPAKEHKQTFIVLHGRGDTGHNFAASFLDHPIEPTIHQGRLIGLQGIRTTFPHAKFIFPTACLGRATTWGQLAHQWFDNWSPLINPEQREELMIEGLAETSSFVHSLLQAEIDIVGAKNVVLIGMSQGCAATIVSLLTWQGEPIGAAVGMCGWLPFRKQMLEKGSDEVNGVESGQVEDPEDETAVDGDHKPSQAETAKLQRIADWLRNELGITGTKSTAVPFQQIPIFLGHGVDDAKVRCELGRLASGFLKEVGIDARWNENEVLGFKPYNYYAATRLPIKFTTHLKLSALQLLPGHLKPHSNNTPSIQKSCTESESEPDGAARRATMTTTTTTLYASPPAQAHGDATACYDRTTRRNTTAAEAAHGDIRQRRGDGLDLIGTTKRGEGPARRTVVRI